MVRVGELVDLLNRNSLSKHDLELIFSLDGLGGCFTLGSLELCEVSLSLCLCRRRWLLWRVQNILNRAALKMLAELLHFPHKLVCACLNSQCLSPNVRWAVGLTLMGMPVTW